MSGLIINPYAFATSGGGGGGSAVVARLMGTSTTLSTSHSVTTAEGEADVDLIIAMATITSSGSGIQTSATGWSQLLVADNSNFNGITVLKKDTPAAAAETLTLTTNLSSRLVYASYRLNTTATLEDSTKPNLALQPSASFPWELSPTWAPAAGLYFAVVRRRRTDWSATDSWFENGTAMMAETATGSTQIDQIKAYVDELEVADSADITVTSGFPGESTSDINGRLYLLVALRV
jgi:hypothetical protein